MAVAKPINVMFVINGLGTGGAQRSLLELLPRLADAEIRPSIVVLDSLDEGVEGEVRERGYPVRVVDERNVAARIARLRRMITTEQPNIVHTAIFESDLAGRVAAIRKPAAVLTSLVNTSYDPIRLKDPNVRARRLRAAKQIDAWTARHLTTHFHAISHAVKAAAIQDLGIRPDRVTVIERGRDISRLGEPSPERRARSRTSLGLGETDRVLLTVGRQEYQKGQRFLLEAMSLLREQPNLVLLIAGRRGHASPDLDRTVRQLGLEDRVRLLGHRLDVPELLAAADVFVFPSLYEGLGGALIEAMALGMPVVASKIDAIEEVVENGGSATLVESGRPAELAAAIASLLDDPVRARAFADRGREIFFERFTLDRSAERMIELYRSLAMAAPRSGRTAVAT
jgi:glycosyltransferase involved in cell wall biosynthesis